jgi:hypothetical protein
MPHLGWRLDARLRSVKLGQLSADAVDDLVARQ